MTRSEDAGERWYDLIRSDADLELIAKSLRDQAARLRTLAKSRQMSGPQAVARQKLRTEADECILIARRAEELTPRG